MLVTVIWLSWPNGRGLMWPRLDGRGSLAMDLLMAVAHWPWTRYYGRGFSAVDMLLMAVAHLLWTHYWPCLLGRGHGTMAVAHWPWTRYYGRGFSASSPPI